MEDNLICENCGHKKSEHHDEIINKWCKRLDCKCPKFVPKKNEDCNNCFYCDLFNGVKCCLYEVLENHGCPEEFPEEMICKNFIKRNEQTKNNENNSLAESQRGEGVSDTSFLHSSGSVDKKSDEEIMQEVFKDYWRNTINLNLRIKKAISLAREDERKKYVGDLLSKDNHILGCMLEGFENVLIYRGLKKEADMLLEVASRIK